MTGFELEQKMREEVAELVDETIVYTTKVLTDEELKDENIRLSNK